MPIGRLAGSWRRVLLEPALGLQDIPDDHVEAIRIKLVEGMSRDLAQFPPPTLLKQLPFCPG